MEPGDIVGVVQALRLNASHKGWLLAASRQQAPANNPRSRWGYVGFVGSHADPVSIVRVPVVIMLAQAAELLPDPLVSSFEGCQVHLGIYLWHRFMHSRGNQAPSNILSHASSTSRLVRYSPYLASSFCLSTRKVSPGKSLVRGASGGSSVGSRMSSSSRSVKS